MSDKKFNEESVLIEPADWQETKQWLVSLGEDNAFGKVAEALDTSLDDINFYSQRAPMFIGLGILTRNWEKFVGYFGSSKRAGQIVNLLNSEKSLNETRAIRVVDTLFDAIANNIHRTGIKEILSWYPASKDDYKGEFSDDDWNALITELKSPESIFLSDLEMGKINKFLNSEDFTKGPSRYIASSLWSGRSGIKEVTGDFSKSIKYCKENFLKV